jgi:BED zinc finger
MIPGVLHYSGPERFPVTFQLLELSHLEGEDLDLLYCSYCNSTETESYSANNSSAMTKHINRKHPLVIIEKSISKNQEVVNQQLRQLYR